MAIQARILVPLLVVLFAGASVGTALAETTNPPPSRPFSGYGAYELKDVVLDAEDAAQKGKDKAADQLRANVQQTIVPVVAEWTANHSTAADAPRLVIEPRVDSIRKVSGGARFWGGALAGDSHVRMHVRFVEEPGDVVIADPEFYQRAAAMSGAWTMGAQDNDMLRRITVIIADYMRANYDHPVGGPTGYPK
jgi:hypothetical protein